MSILKILKYPDKRLRITAKYVKKIDYKILAIINDMFDTMYYANGIGLAATQVNINMQIVVIDVSEKQNQPLVLVNPIILEKNGLISTEEGCLSIPNQRAYINRFETIKINALNHNGEKFFLCAKNILSVCIQHEVDHLMGKLFIDHLSLIKKKIILKKIKKMLNKKTKNKYDK